MPSITSHPAPGLGDLLPGWYVVPQNPIAAAQDGTTYVPTIGEILPGSYVVPQNPIVDFTTGTVKLIGQRGGGSPTPGQLNGIVTVPGRMGMSGCGCGGSCGGGMGDISTDLALISTDLSSGNFLQAIQDPLLSFPLWGWIAGAIVLSMFVLAPSEGRSRYSRARRALAAY
jgi:hypothetical protein